MNEGKKKRQFHPWKSQELPKIGCGPSQGEHSQGLLCQSQHWEGDEVSQWFLPCSSARGQLHHIPLTGAEQPRAVGQGGAAWLRCCEIPLKPGVTILLFTAELPMGHKTPSSTHAQKVGMAGRVEGSQISAPSCPRALMMAVTQAWRIFPIFPGAWYMQAEIFHLPTPCQQQPLSPLCFSRGFGLLPNLAGTLLTLATASHIWEP